MAATDAPPTTYGVHSEVGKLRKVMVCRPGLAHLRLTPDNCHDLLFDDVIWVQEAEKEHFAFAQLMRERGIDVVEMHDLLAQTLEELRGARLAPRPQDQRQFRKPHRVGGDPRLVG